MLVSVGLRARIAGQNVRVSMAEQLQLLTPSIDLTPLALDRKQAHVRSNNRKSDKQGVTIDSIDFVHGIGN